MGYSLIDYYLWFDELTLQRYFSAGVRSVYYALLSAFNRARYVEELPMTVRDLQAKAGLKSVATVHECCLVLKNAGLIDWRRAGGHNVYRLKAPNARRTSTEQLANTSRTSSSVFSMRGCEEEKTLEKKTLDGPRGEEARNGTGGQIDWRRYSRIKV